MEWIISANVNIYDHIRRFEKWGYVDWKQKANYKLDDFVFIYSTRPYQKIMFKTQVTKIDMNFSEIRNDKEFWQNVEDYEKTSEGKFVRLKLIEKIDSEILKLEKLKENGLKAAPQGPMKIKDKALSEYINKYFNYSDANNYYCEEGFCEESEGKLQKVFVNKYERSAIARDKCIEMYGWKCSVCQMDFESVYGEVGRDFIHVHHIVPLSQIGLEYKVDYAKDLVTVCPNCHAMLHRKMNGKYLSVSELKKTINNK